MFSRCDFKVKHSQRKQCILFLVGESNTQHTRLDNKMDGTINESNADKLKDDLHFKFGSDLSAIQTRLQRDADILSELQRDGQQVGA